MKIGQNLEIDFFTIEKLSNVHYLYNIIKTTQYVALCPTEESFVSLIGGQ
jgi:hypothetical protein